MYPSIPSGLLSWGLISPMCKISDWGQEWLWTREPQWNQTLDLGLISNRIKPIELIVYRHFALNNPQLKRGRSKSEKKYIMILVVTSVKEEARPIHVRFYPFHRVYYAIIVIYISWTTGQWGENEDASEIFFFLSQPLSAFALAVDFQVFDVQKDEAINTRGSSNTLTSYKKESQSICFPQFWTLEESKPCHAIDLRRWKY